MYGSAIATFISFFVSVIMIYRFSKKFYFIKWENYKLTISFLIAMLIVIPFYLFKLENLTISISLSLIAIIAFPLILYFFKFYEEIEVKTMKNFIYNIIKKRN